MYFKFISKQPALIPTSTQFISIQNRNLNEKIFYSITGTISSLGLLRNQQLNVTRLKLLILLLSAVFAVVFVTNFALFAGNALEQYYVPSSSGRYDRAARLSSSTLETQASLEPDLNSSFDKELGRHFYRDDGLLEVNYDGSHPMLELIERAEEEWRNKHARASRTLREAVDEYERRYGRLPPKGFDDWWNFTMEHNVKLPDEYDNIHADLEPYWGIHPSDLAHIQEHWVAQRHHIVSIIGKREGGRLTVLNASSIRHEGRDRRVKLKLQLLEPVQHLLPDFEATIDPTDNPAAVATWEAKEMLLKAAGSGTYVNTSELATIRPAVSGWAAACSPDSPARLLQDTLDHDSYLLPPPPRSSPETRSKSNTYSNPKTFIHNHESSMSPCYHPSLFRISGQFLSHAKHPPIKEYPILQFSSCSTGIYYDVAVVPPSRKLVTAREEKEGFEAGEGVSWLRWENKSDERLLWRGSNTGIHASSSTDYMHTQRMRLVSLTSPHPSSISLLILRSPTAHNESSSSLPRLDNPEEWRLDHVNPAVMDIFFIKKPKYCDPDACEMLEREFEWKSMMGEEEAMKYKYVFDVDGNGWSSRFLHLLSTNSVVFKSTIYPEWFTPRIQPYMHYVPISLQYSELYDTLFFFRGDPTGKGAHDHLARRIAEQARRWRREYAREVDATAYMFRLILEYARIMSPDREAMTMTRESVRDL